MRNLLCAVMAFTAIAFLSHTYADDLSKEISISNAWVQAMPPSQSVSAGYLVISNNSQKEIILMSASSDIAGVTEIHEMSQVNGIMHMAKVPNLPIPAQGKVSLQPGGFHIMLINLKKSANNGDIVHITLHFQDGRSMTVNAQVKSDE